MLKDLKNISIAHARTRVMQSSPTDLEALKQMFLDTLSLEEMRFYEPKLDRARPPTRFIVFAHDAILRKEQELYP